MTGFDVSALPEDGRRIPLGVRRHLNTLAVLLLTTASINGPAVHLPPSQRPYGVRGVTRQTDMRTPNPQASAIVQKETAEIDLGTVKYGDTGGAALRVTKGDLQAGTKPLMQDVDWAIMPGERWALVGENGCGKSSLLRAITGTGSDILSFSGSAVVKPRTRVGYLVQTAVSGSTKTVKEEAASHMLKLQNAKNALDVATSVVESADEPSAEQLDAFVRAQADFETAGGYDADARIARVLTGLGFSGADQERTCDQFSGGWQMRIALARLLLSEPDLLLLDEPTNHLDAAACGWLADYISAYPGSTIVVSHDEALVSKLDCVAEVARGTVSTYKGGWQSFKVQRKEREKQAAARYEALTRQADELEAFVKKWGASATKASMANDRKKKLAKVKSEIEKIPDGLRKTVKSTTNTESKQNLQLALAPVAPPQIVGLDEADISYGTKDSKLEDIPILSGVKLVVNSQTRILLLGPNGAGKSTLLKAIAGRLPLRHGRRLLGDEAKLGYFSQDLAQELDLTKTAFEEVQERAGRRADAQAVRSTLGAVGLSGEAAMRPISFLSGGEKARVALAAFALKPSHLLLLDEPNNHLDAAMLSVLSKSLASWNGALVVSSHMRSFCKSVQWTHIAHVSSGNVTIYQRGLSHKDWGWLEEVAKTGEKRDEEKALSPEQIAAKQERIEANMAFKRSGRDFKRLQQLEKLIATREAKIEKLGTEMMNVGSDLDRVSELNENSAALQAEVDALYDEYMLIEEKYEQ